jgi:TatD DNase family protein
MKIVDSHAHLDDDALIPFTSEMRGLEDKILVLSNSVNFESSIRNLGLARATRCVKAFVGIHPEVFRAKGGSFTEQSVVDSESARVSGLISDASGIGEIGLDPKFGSLALQRRLFENFLDIAERTRLPVTIHSRESVQEIMEIISTREIRANILFHWFAGTEAELRKLQGKGYYVSFGPSILFSKRLASLFNSGDNRYVLAETDSPTRFEAITGSSPSSPFLVSSVIFRMALILEKSFDCLIQITNENAMRYLATQD